MMFSGQMTDDRRQRLVCRCAARFDHESGKAATTHQSSVLSPQSSDRGFTLIELVIVICIISILAGLFFKRVLFYQEMAEKAAVQQVVGALQSAMVLQYGHRMTMGLGDGEKNIVRENPMDWLMQKPGNYAGEFNQVNPAKMEPGTWVFDKSVQELIYYPNHAEYFKPSSAEVKWIRYKTRLLYEPNYRNKKIQELAGLTLSPVEPYTWLIREQE